MAGWYPGSKTVFVAANGKDVYDKLCYSHVTCVMSFWTCCENTSVYTGIHVQHAVKFLTLFSLIPLTKWFILPRIMVRLECEWHIIKNTKHTLSTAQWHWDTREDWATCRVRVHWENAFLLSETNNNKIQTTITQIIMTYKRRPHK